MNPALFPVIASLMGIGPDGKPLSHNRGYYEGMPKQNYGVLKYEHLPLAGSERGDRAEIERIFAGTFALPSGQPTIISRELPVGDPWLAMRLNLRGQLVGAAGAAGTVLADAPLPLFRLSLTTDIDREVVEPDVSARALYRYNQIVDGTAGELVAPTVVVATTTDFNAVVTIPFVDRLVDVPMDTVLDTRRYNAVTLTITSGVLSDIVSGAANVTLGSLFVDVEIIRVSPRVPLPLTVAKVLPFYKRHAPFLAPANTTLNLDRVPTYAIKRIGVFTATSPVAGVPFTGAGSNVVLDTLRISSNYRDHFGSAQGGVSRRTLQAGNKADYHLETWPTGWYWADFVLDRSNWSALATGDKSTLQALLTYQSGLAGTEQVSVMIAGLQKLRGAEAA